MFKTCRFQIEATVKGVFADKEIFSMEALRYKNK